MDRLDPPHGRPLAPGWGRRGSAGDGSGRLVGRPGRTVLADGSGDPADGRRDEGPDAHEGREIDDPEGVTKDLAAFGPAEFREEAEEFAAGHGDRGFDFSVDSLDELDVYAAEQAEVLAMLEEEGEEDLLADAAGGYVLRFGSYFGEVLVREFDGEWVRGDDGFHVRVPAGDFTVDMPALDAALAALREVPRFADLADDLAATVEDAEAGDLSTGAPGTLREEVRSTAGELVEFYPEYDLDYSPGSLVRLDELVDAAWESERFADAEYGGDEAVDVSYTGVVRKLGSYFGEVLVRSLDGEWVQDPGTAVAVRGQDDAETVDVFDVAEDCLTTAPVFAATYERTRRRLDLEDADPVDLE